MRLVLKPHERQMVIEAREAEAKRFADLRFQIKVIKTAGKAWEWSIRNDSGLTFSTFVNEFGYQENDASQVYEAVDSLLWFARSNFDSSKGG